MKKSISTIASHFQAKKHLILKDPSSILDKILDREDILLATKNIELESRERFFSSFTTLWIFLWQVLDADQSCRAAVVRWISTLGTGNKDKIPSSNTAAFCKARKRLCVKLIKNLCLSISEKLSRSQPDIWLWKNHHVKLVDATTFSMPDTAANQAMFPQQRGQKIGLGFPIARVVGIFSNSSGALLNAAIGPFKGKLSGETSLLRTLLDTFSSNDVALFDRCYSGYLTIALFF